MEEQEIVENNNDAVEQQIQETQEQIEKIHEDAIQEKKSSKEENLAALRKKLKEKDRALEELYNRLDSLEQSLRRPQEPEEVINDDDLVNLRQTRKHAEKIAEEIVERKLKEQSQKNFKTVLRQEYRDYDDVMTEDNILQLEEELPELAEAILNMPDRVKAGAAAYKAIKKMMRENSSQREIEENKKAIKKNAEKPLSNAAIDRRPIAQVARYTEQDYGSLWEEVEKYARKA